MSAIADKISVMVAAGAKLSEVIDAALADGYVLDLKMRPNVPGNSSHKIIVLEGETVEMKKL